MLYPLALFFLLTKMTSRKTTVVHVHWLEFMYRAGDHKWLIPVLVPIMVLYFKVIRSFGIKVVVTLHNVTPHETYFESIEYIGFRAMLKEIASVVFVHSEYQRELSSLYYGIDESKIVVVKHGSSRTIPVQATESKSVLRRKLGIPEGSVVFSLIGTIARYKGVEVLLEAIRRLDATKDSADCRFIIAGRTESGYLHHLRAEYGEITSSPKVIFRPWHIPDSQLESFLLITDFGVCPYTKATTPSALLDFVSFGIPLIVSDDPNCTSMLKDYPALYVKRGDVDSLAGTIEHSIRLNAEGRIPLRPGHPVGNSWIPAARRTLQIYLELT